MTRRNFFKLIAGAGLIAVAPRMALSAPLLTGDGRAADAPALQALIDGLPVEFGPLVDATDAGWAGNVLTMPRGKFSLAHSLRFVDLGDVVIDGNGSTLLAGLDCDGCLQPGGDARQEFRNFYFGRRTIWDTPLKPSYSPPSPNKGR